MLQIRGVPFMQGVLTLELSQIVAVLMLMLLAAFLVYAIVPRYLDFRDVPVRKTTGTILEKIYTPSSFVSGD